jgi:hypothetical protein
MTSVMVKSTLLMAKGDFEVVRAIQGVVRARYCQEWGLEAITYLDKDRTMAKIFGRGLEPRDQ